MTTANSPVVGLTEIVGSVPTATRASVTVGAGGRLVADGVGLATADRDLVLMVETGDVDVLTGDEGEAVHFRCSRQHHHHLVCRSRVRH